jgi:hypothetical protein
MHISRSQVTQFITQDQEEKAVIIFVIHTLITSLCDSVSRLASSGVPGITVKKGNSLWGYQRSFSHEPRPASELQAQCAAHPIRSDAHENSNSQFKNKTKQNKANQPTIQSTIKAAVQGTTHPICSPHRSSTLATTQRVSRQKLTLAGRSTDKTLKPGRAKGSRWGVMRKGTVQP